MKLSVCIFNLFCIAFSKVVALDEEAKGVATTSINAFEIYFGAYKSKLQNENLKETERLLDRLQVIPMDQSSLKKAAEISAKLGALGEANRLQGRYDSCNSS